MIGTDALSATQGELNSPETTANKATALCTKAAIFSFTSVARDCHPYKTHPIMLCASVRTINKQRKNDWVIQIEQQ